MPDVIRRSLVRTLIVFTCCVGTFGGTLAVALATGPEPLPPADGRPHTSSMVCEKDGLRVSCHGSYAD